MPVSNRLLPRKQLCVTPCIQSVCWTQHHDRSQSPKRVTVELRDPIQPEATFLASSDYAQITLADSKEICHVSVQRFSHPSPKEKRSWKAVGCQSHRRISCTMADVSRCRRCVLLSPPPQTRLQKGSAHFEHVPEILIDDERCAKYA